MLRLRPSAVFAQTKKSPFNLYSSNGPLSRGHFETFRKFSSASPKLFTKILIANRGEIACRVIKTAKEMGIKTVAVFSEADKKSQHVQLADEAYLIGPPAPSASYLNGKKLIEVAKQAGAQAIHPGYGFLSENSSFAQLCADNGIVFIGPPPQAILAMGSKSESKKLMTSASVPIIPGYHGDDQSFSKLKEEAKKIGYPVIIKAVMGGGGKGMKIVENENELEENIQSAKREAMSSFADDRVLIEKYLRKPRHIEFQIFADKSGNCVYLFERDCSIQRRHQKVVEEAPAPGMTEDRRKKMGDTAVKAAKAVGYVNAGTVEFIVDEDNTFYFMEMNTRLQVEHPVTEVITRQDLVRWQLLVASGFPLPLSQEDLKIHGHGFEVRIYAENPEKGFLPGTGKLLHLSPPPTSSHIRVDTGVVQGDEVTPFYDPMIAKLITWGKDRHEAIQWMKRAVEQYQIVGLNTNLKLIHKIFNEPDFVKGDVHTAFIPQHEQSLLFTHTQLSLPSLHFAALFVLQQQAKEVTSEKVIGNSDPFSPWRSTNGKRLNFQHEQVLEFIGKDDTRYLVQVTFVEDGYVLTVKQKGKDSKPLGPPVHVSGEVNKQGDINAYIGDRLMQGTVVQHSDALEVFVDGQNHTLRVMEKKYGTKGEEKGSLLAPMHGRIVKVNIKKGDQVKRGEALLVMEAMKMEHTIRSPADGVVQAIYYSTGDLVEEKKLLVLLK